MPYFFKMSDFRQGWIIGGFSPAAHKWDGGEIAIKSRPKGKKITFFCEEDGTYMFVLLKGKCLVNDQEVSSGQVVVGDRGEKLVFLTLDDTVFSQILIRDKTAESDPETILDEVVSKYRNAFEDDNLTKDKSGIDPKDITVVVQGAIDNRWTPVCLKSIRRFLPGSHIVLSTWEGSDASGLDYDVLVKSADPGAGENGILKPYDKNFKNNVNRQLISTQAGLKHASTKYAMKIRSDMILTTNGFMQYFDEYPLSTDEYRIFNHKIIISELFSKYEHEAFVDGDYKRFPIPFHPSDWFFFGETDDIYKYFMNTKKMPSSCMGGYADYIYPERERDFKCGWNMQFVPEQYLAISALRENGFSVEMHDWTDWNDEYISQSERFLLNNFIILSFSNSGIFLPKYKNRILANSGRGEYGIKGLFTQQRYEDLYGRLENHQS